MTSPPAALYIRISDPNGDTDERYGPALLRIP